MDDLELFLVLVLELLIVRVALANYQLPCILHAASALCYQDWAHRRLWTTAIAISHYRTQFSNQNWLETEVVRPGLGLDNVLLNVVVRYPKFAMLVTLELYYERLLGKI